MANICRPNGASIEFARVPSVASFACNDPRLEEIRFCNSSSLSITRTNVFTRYQVTGIQTTSISYISARKGKDNHLQEMRSNAKALHSDLISSEDCTSLSDCSQIEEDTIRVLNCSHSRFENSSVFVDRRRMRRTGAEPIKKSKQNVITEALNDGGYSSGKAKSGSWAHTAGSSDPLGKEEELIFYTRVQDLLFLESKKDELQSKLQRKVTIEEWATYVGVSICRLYARIGLGRAAKRKMIAANLPLVDSVAKKYHGKGLSHWELCQEGVWGLLKSAEKYDISFKAKFSTYAFFWIQEKISTAARKFGKVLSVGRSFQRSAGCILRHKESFEEVNNRKPTLDELAMCSNFTKEKIHKIFRALSPSRSLEHTTASISLERFCIESANQKSGFQPWQTLKDQEFKMEMKKAMHTLSARERKVLELRYGVNGHLPQSRAQVALKMDLHYETTRITEKLALKKLQKFDLNYYFVEDIRS